MKKKEKDSYVALEKVLFSLFNWKFPLCLSPCLLQFMTTSQAEIHHASSLWLHADVKKMPQAFNV